MSHPNNPYGSYSHNHYNNNDYSQNAPYNQQQQYQQYSDYPQQQPGQHFQGSALYNHPSYSASQQSIGNYPPSEYASSVYALNTNNVPDNTSSQYHDEPSHGASGSGMPMSPMGNSRNIEEEKRAYYESPREKSSKKKLIGAAVALLIIVLAIVGFCVYWFAIRPKSSSGGSGGSTGSQQDKGKSLAVTGGDGTKVMLEDGTSITYNNPHGGHWYYDVNDPFNDGARPQSWSPALNETFNYGVDKIRGVNLGGWLTIEPFISPALFEKYINNVPHPVDEWTLHEAMAADTAGGGLNQVEDHYKTFITEKDFAEIAAAGLNYVRLAIPFWAIETRKGEPFLAKVAWKYFLKAVGWARKYGIRINLDLHAVPGSQNGWNHSGRLGEASFLHGPMGYANAQRTLDYIRVLAEFISQPQYKNVITFFGIINEPRCEFTGKDQLSGFYAQAYKIVRDAGGPWVSIHDCMNGKDAWADFLPNADRLTLDTHPYMAFGGQDANGWASKISTPCQWGNEFNSSQTKFGLNNAGEWSLGINDCGLFLNGVDEGVRYEGNYIDPSFKRVGSCDQWTDWENYSDQTKQELKSFVLASMDALQNYFFWTWKIGPSLAAGKVVTPAWSYQLGLQNSWIPQDPREATGACGNTSPWIGPLKMGNGNVNIDAYPWPPVSIQDAGSPNTLPSYVTTGTIVTLQGGTLTVNGVKPTKDADLGSGWSNGKDQQPFAVEDPNCNYLDAWIGTKAAAPTPLCGGPPVAVVPSTTAKAGATPAKPVATPAKTTAGTKGVGKGVVGDDDDDDKRRRRRMVARAKVTPRA